MDAVRVSISYRPLRIAWAIHAGDMEALRRTVRMSYALWGGRYNPIVIVDREEEADRLVEAYRPDLIVTVGDSRRLNAFPKRFPHLIYPLLGPVFINEQGREGRCQVLDIHNEFAYLRHSPELKAIKDAGVVIYSWKADDPLADALLLQFGGYPSIEEVGTDYRNLILEATEAKEREIDPALPISEDILETPTIPFFCSYGLRRQYRGGAGWDNPGVFVGDAQNFDDLVCYWNLRAADIRILFIDTAQLDRYGRLIAAWEKRIAEAVLPERRSYEGRLAGWARSENKEKLQRAVSGRQMLLCEISEDSWGTSIRPPTMYYKTVSTLGVMGEGEDGKPKVSFALSDKPFSSDGWFHTQHLIASITSVGGLFRDERHTLSPPFIPELNEFYARQMCWHYGELRIERDGVGLLIDAVDADKYLYALPIVDLAEQIFGLAGLRTKVSSGGLILRQLVSRLGGLQGGRVFKIPGVRRLLKTYGPTATFSKNGALQLIAGKDPENPKSKFTDHEDLYIKGQPIGDNPHAIFSYLVEKGLFRIGVDLTCESCHMPSWIAVDALKQSVLCELCGDEYDASSQLVKAEWRYRRSGVLGKEKNSQGAVCVALTLQQLQTNISELFNKNIYSPSIEVEPQKGGSLQKCEIDFVWFHSHATSEKISVILGECKDQGPIDLEDFKKDIDNLRQVADVLPRHRFDVFILIAKLSPFTADEIEAAKSLNDRYHQRAILLTAEELEPYRMYERSRGQFKFLEYASSPEDFARGTAAMYFEASVGDKVEEV